ncbi:MAG: DNA ligase [Gemmatimonadetes bacterium]|nr:DNA ligase [Gemmatimonadota bacterium]
MRNPLQLYRTKRNFRRTPEPRGRRPRPSARPVFVIQKHAATTLHYDFRLEVGGVLKSWVVPKGPPSGAKTKRLAMATEDHPLEYAAFEGVIPQGEYGAGPMMIWDRGPYRNLMEKDGEPVPIDQALEDGHLVVGLEGKKLTGAYILRRMGGDPRKWLLMKRPPSSRASHSENRRKR